MYEMYGIGCTVYLIKKTVHRKKRTYSSPLSTRLKNQSGSRSLPMATFKTLTKSSLYTTESCKTHDLTLSCNDVQCKRAHRPSHLKCSVLNTG